MLRELKGKERGEGAGETEKGRTARLGASSVLGVRAGRRRRVARSRSVGEEPEVGLAGESGAWPTSGRDVVPDVRRRRTVPSRRETERREERWW